MPVIQVDESNNAVGDVSVAPCVDGVQLMPDQNAGVWRYSYTTYQKRSGGYGYLQPPALAPTSTSFQIPADLDQNGGVATMWNGSRMIVVAAPSNPEYSLKYGRLKSEGGFVNTPKEVKARGVPLDVVLLKDRAAVSVVDGETVRLFARTLDTDDEFYKPGVIAQRKGLKSPTLVANGDELTLFFLADDEGGTSQVYATNVQCAQPEN